MDRITHVSAVLDTGTLAHWVTVTSPRFLGSLDGPILLTRGRFGSNYEFQRTSRSPVPSRGASWAYTHVLTKIYMDSKVDHSGRWTLRIALGIRPL